MSPKSNRPSFVADIAYLRLLAAPLIWSIHFLAVYILTALVSAGTISQEPDTTRMQLIGITAVAALLLGALLFHSLSKLRQELRDAPISKTMEPNHPRSVGHRKRESAVSWFVIDGVSFLALFMVAAPIAFLPI